MGFVLAALFAEYLLKEEIMGTLTAFVFIGTSHQNHGGINPTHYISLSENSRPCLQLRRMDNNKEIIAIIPTVECMVDDIHFLVYAFVLEQKYKNFDYNLKEMHQLFTDDERKSIYDEVRNGLKGINIKLVFNILAESTLLNQLDKIKQYPNDYEVTTPIFSKEYSQWKRKDVVIDYR